MFVAAVFNHWTTVVAAVTFVTGFLEKLFKPKEGWPETLKVVWRNAYLWILGLAFLLVSIFLAWQDQYNKVVELSDLEPKVTFEFENTPEYVISPDRRKTYIDPETKQPNWVILFKVKTNRKLVNACMWVTRITGPSGLLIEEKRKIGWTGFRESFNCTDIVDEQTFALFHCQVSKDGKEKLQLFFEPGIASHLDYEPLTHMESGRYKFALLLSAENISKPVKEMFQVDWFGSLNKSSDFDMKQY